MDNRLRILTRRPKPPEQSSPVKQTAKKEGLSASETLIRNSAIACALMLSLMAVNNVDSDWSRRITGGVKDAVTMRINWDDSLGRLRFVRALVPETALVYLSSDGQGRLLDPVRGEVRHLYSEQQPWLLYECGAQEPVWAAMEGKVATVGQGAAGDWVVLIDHGDGVETLYGYLSEVEVAVGQQVTAGTTLGKASADGRVYLEYRENGTPVDPAQS